MRQDEKFTLYEGVSIFTLTFLSHMFGETLPNLLDDMGPAAWMSQIVSGVLAFGVLGLFLLLYRRYPGMDLLQIFDRVFGKAVSKVMQLVLFAYLLLFVASMLNQEVETLQMFTYSNMSALKIDLMVMAAVAVFALYSLKGLAKAISIFLPVILAAVLLILALSHEQYDIDLLNPIWGRGVDRVVYSSLPLVSKFNSVLLLAVVSGSFSGRKAYAQSCIWGILISSVVFGLATFCYCMAIPYANSEDIYVGLVGLAQSNYNGRFFQRLESTYVAVSVMAVMFLAGYGFLMLKKIYCHMFSIGKKYSRAVIVPLAAIIICVARTMGNNHFVRAAVRTVVRKYSGFVFVCLIAFTLLVSLIRRQGKGGGRGAARAACLLLVPCLLAGLFSGCSNYSEPDDEIFPIVMGYDKGQKEKYRITMKFMTESKTPEGQDAKSKDSEPKGETPDDVMVFEAPSFSEGIHLINSLMPRRVSMLHIKLLILSEEIAREGVDEIISPLMRYNEIKPTIALAICKGSAYDLVASKNPTLTAPTVSDLEMVFGINQQSTNFIVTSLSEFLYGYKSTYGQAMAIYSSLNQAEYKDGQQEGDSPVDKIARTPAAFEGGYLAGELPAMGNRELELAGMAVFREDKMVGTLNTRECQTLALLGGYVRDTQVAFPDPQEPEKYYVSLDMCWVQPVEIRTRVDEEGKAHISIHVMVNGLVGVSQNPKANYIDNPGQRHMLNDYAGDQMRRRCLDLVQKLQQEYDSDVLRLGRRVARNFRTIQEWEAFDWQEQFKNAEIDVDFDIFL